VIAFDLKHSIKLKVFVDVVLAVVVVDIILLLI
jgi:hypothetical protein